MKRKVGSLFVVVTMIIQLLSVTTCFATDISGEYTWNEVPIGGGGYVTGIVGHPVTTGLIYCRTDVGGAYKWDEASGKWLRITRTSNVQNLSGDINSVESLNISKSNNQVVYAAIGNNLKTATGRIIKSTDGGESWTDPSTQRWFMGANERSRTGSERLCVDPANPDVVYFGSRKEGLWVTTDGGVNWNQVSTSVIPVGTTYTNYPPIGVKWVVFDPNSGTTNGKTNRIYVGVAREGVFRSDDAGASWRQILVDKDNTPQGPEVTSTGTLYVPLSTRVVAADYLKKYDPVADTWSNIPLPFANGGWDLAIDPFDSNRMFMTTGGMKDQELIRTTDGGASWTRLDISVSSPDVPWIINTNEENYMSTGKIMFDPMIKDRLWFAQGTGVWRSNDLSDTEVTWTFVSKGIEETCATDVIAPSTGKVVATIADRQGFYYDNLNTYPTRPIFDNQFSSSPSVDYSGLNPNQVAAVQYDHRDATDRYIWFSDDSGANWTRCAATPDLKGGEIAVSASDAANMVWVGSGYNVNPFVTTDRGATWTELTWFGGNKTFHQDFWWFGRRSIAADRVEGGVFYIRTGGAFYRSSDSGKTWEKAPANAPAGLGDDHVYAQIEAVPGKAGHVWVSADINGLYYTSDKGDTWTKLPAFEQARAIGFGKAMGTSTYPTVFVDGKIAGEWAVWRSTDKGNTWDKVVNYPGDIYGKVFALTGDMSSAGKIIAGISGNGFVYGTYTGNGTIATPPPESTSKKFEAELYSNTSAGAGVTWGTPGYIDVTSAGEYGEWANIKVPSSGTYTITYRYKTGRVNAGMNVTINGVSVGTKAFPTTNWSTWATTSMDVTLKAGYNTLRLTAGSSGGVHLDCFEIGNKVGSVTPTPTATPTPTTSPTPTPASQQGAYLESGGKVSIEAETALENSSYAYVTARSSHAWSSTTGSSANAMFCSPDNGLGWTDTATLNTQSPEMTYKVKLSTAGTYNVWLLCKGPSTGSDSVHLGYGDSYKFTNTSLGSSTFVWKNAGTFTGISAGYNEINVWAREDGVIIDKIYLTTGTDTPSNTGPSESARESLPAPFAEANGKVCIEAEAAIENSAYAYVTARSSHTWSSTTGSSADAMFCSPDNGSGWTDTATLNTQSPEMTFKVKFSTAGTYNVWLLYKGPSTGSDSVHLGFGDTFKFTDLSLGSSSFVWKKVGTFSSVTAGVREINIWAREDGFIIDKIYLTTGTDTPSGTGPVQSPRN